jgi:cobalt transporter subunit CbtA
MTKNLVSSAVFAGLVAGCFAAALQFMFVIPLLLEGELYESGSRIHFATDGTTQSDKGAPPLGTEWARHALTVGFNIVTYTGYGLILAAAMVFAGGRGHVLTAKTGLVWGLCGFVIVQLAPAVGLPPELPGTIAGELFARQIWWFGTIVATAAGVWLIAFGATAVLALIGVILCLLPHVIGAPHLDTYFGIAPPELSAEFATRSMGTALFGWTLLGGATAYFLTRGENAD